MLQRFSAFWTKKGVHPMLAAKDAANDDINGPRSDAHAWPCTPGTPGSLWRDDKGRLRRVPLEPAARHGLGVHEATLRFLKWLRDSDLTGWHTGDEIVGLYVWHCAEEGLEEISRDALRERLAAMPGVESGRRRLATAAFATLRRYLERTGRPAERAEVYRICSHEELAARAEAVRAEAVATLPPPGAAEREPRRRAVAAPREARRMKAAA